MASSELGAELEARREVGERLCLELTRAFVRLRVVRGRFERLSDEDGKRIDAVIDEWDAIPKTDIGLADPVAEYLKDQARLALRRTGNPYMAAGGNTPALEESAGQSA